MIFTHGTQTDHILTFKVLSINLHFPDVVDAAVLVAPVRAVVQPVAHVDGGYALAGTPQPATPIGITVDTRTPEVEGLGIIAEVAGLVPAVAVVVEGAAVAQGRFRAGGRECAAGCGGDEGGESEDEDVDWHLARISVPLIFKYRLVHSHNHRISIKLIYFLIFRIGRSMQPLSLNSAEGPISYIYSAVDRIHSIRKYEAECQWLGKRVYEAARGYKYSWNVKG